MVLTGDDPDAQVLSEAVITALSGDDQDGEVGSTLALELVVEVQDAAGVVLPNAPVEWTFAQGGGVRAQGQPATSVSTVTDASGRASITWQLGTGAGNQEASAEISVPNPASSTEPSLAPGNGNGRKVGFRAHAKPAGPDAVTVSPASVTVETGDSTQLIAEVSDRYGNVLTGATAAWQSVDETVAMPSGSGMVYALDEGETTVVASYDTVEGSATVTVQGGVVSQAPVAMIDAPTQDLTVTLGDAVSFQGSAHDADGSVVSHAWNFGDGNTASVEDPGAHAYTDTGAYSVTYQVTDDDGLTSNVATRTITVDAGPPPPSDVLFDEAFEDNNWTSRGWYDIYDLIRTTDEAHTGSSALELRFQVGSQQPVGAGARVSFDETESVYLSYWVKYSENWVGSGRPYNPHEFLIVTNQDGQYVGPAKTRLTVYVEHVHETGGGVPVLASQDARNIDVSNIGTDLTGITEQRSVSGCNGSSDGHGGSCWNNGGGDWRNERVWKASKPYFLDAAGPGYKNDWHHVEAYFELNTIQGGVGVADGVVRYWFDGELVIDQPDVLLRTGQFPGMRFNQLLVGPYMDSGSPVAQTIWVDDMTIATAPPPSG